jgi:hypothetical protein
MPDQDRTIDEQIADAEARAAEHREAGRELEEREALERVAVLKAVQGSQTRDPDDRGHSDDMARG